MALYRPRFANSAKLLGSAACLATGSLRFRKRATFSSWRTGAARRRQHAGGCGIEGEDITQGVGDREGRGPLARLEPAELLDGDTDGVGDLPPAPPAGRPGRL